MIRQSAASLHRLDNRLLLSMSYMLAVFWRVLFFERDGGLYIFIPYADIIANINHPNNKWLVSGDRDDLNPISKKIEQHSRYC